MKQPFDLRTAILRFAKNSKHESVLPLPKSIPNKGTPQQIDKIIRGLVKSHMFAVGDTSKLSETLRTNSKGQRLRVMMTDRGRLNMPTDREIKDYNKRNREVETASGLGQPQPPRPSPQTKLETLITLLKRSGGATIKEMVTATKWQPHSVRGAISGALRKARKLKIESNIDAKRGRVYQINGAQ